MAVPEGIQLALGAKFLERRNPSTLSSMSLMFAALCGINETIAPALPSMGAKRRRAFAVAHRGRSFDALLNWNLALNNAPAARSEGCEYSKPKFWRLDIE